MPRPLRSALVALALLVPGVVPVRDLAAAPIRPEPQSPTYGAPPRVVGNQKTAPKESRPEHLKKVSSFLLDLTDRMAADTTAAAKADFAAYSDKLVRVRADGKIAVTVRVSAWDEANRREIERFGYEITYASKDDLFVEGWLSYDEVASVATLDFVTGVRPTFRPVANTGSVTSQGDAILLANQARSTFGATGAGVKVGVISDSVDGIQQAQASGDLAQVQVLKFGEGAGEGTAMLEIVHDLAPDAALAFYGPSSTGDMSAGILALANAGCDVIVDDLAFFASPDFEDGSIANTVNQVAQSGVVYVTAAGNYAESNFQADFDGGGSAGGPTHNVHLFRSNDGSEGFVLPPHGSTAVLLQWANKAGSSRDDFDLYVTDANGTVVETSDDTQDGNDDPSEFAVVTNDGSSSAVFYVFVDLFSGSPQRFDLLIPDLADLEYKSAAGSIGGHQTALGAITVATINAQDSGNDTIAEYSSQGPCDSFFPSPSRRSKPDVTGIDGVSVTGAAGFGTPFFGTSAAAPHIGAIAALMLSYDPNLTPVAILESLQRSSFDVGASGFDFVFGSGRANAVGAVRGFPRVANALVVGKKLVISGTHFAPGVQLFVNGLAQKTKRDKRTPTVQISSNKAAKLIAPGQTVTLVVTNPDGTSSLAYSFTR